MATPTPSNEIAPPATNDPWSDFDRLFDDLGRRFYAGFGIAPFGVARFLPDEDAALRPAASDVTDTGPAYRVLAEIPGVPKEALTVTVRGSTVEIRGEQATDEARTKGEILHRERSYRGYRRSFELPEPVVAAKATAKLVDGVLELELPKQHPTPPAAEVRVPVQ